MSYIGKEPQYTDFLSKFFSGDGTAMTVTLDASPPNEAALLVFIDGVRQDTSAYTVSGYSLTFTGTVPSGTNNVQVVHLGIAQDTQVPVDGSVTSAKLDTNIAIDGDLTVDTNTLHVDSTNNRVGIGTTSPAKELDVSGEIRASTGILFGTDTAAANTLDDYEEGTWTPELWDSSLSGSEGQTYNLQSGNYTKIGRLVHVSGVIQMAGLGTLSGTARIGNLPYGTSGSGRAGGGVATYMGSVSLANIGQVILYSAATSFVLYQSDATTSTTGLSPADITASGSIYFTATYRTQEKQMALTEEQIVDKIEIVGDYSSVQVRTATVIKRDGEEIGRSFHRHVVFPGNDHSNEDAKVQAICAAVHTPEVVAAYQAQLEI